MKNLEAISLIIKLKILKCLGENLLNHIFQFKKKQLLNRGICLVRGFQHSSLKDISFPQIYMFKTILKPLWNLAHSKTCVKIQKAGNSQGRLPGQTAEGDLCAHTSRPVTELRWWDTGVEVNQCGADGASGNTHPWCLQLVVKTATQCNWGNLSFPINALSTKFRDLIGETKCRSKYDM